MSATQMLESTEIDFKLCNCFLKYVSCRCDAYVITREYVCNRERYKI